MKTKFWMLLCMLGLVGCAEHDITVVPSDGGHDSSDGGGNCPVPPDLAPLGPSCLAANGLVGDRLVCVDFSQVTASPFTSDPKLNGWDFTSFGGNCWTVRNGKLQINTTDFTTYKQSCGFLMAALGQEYFDKYNSFTLSVVHSVDISDTAQQKAQVMMGSDDPQNRLVDQTTGKQPRKQWTHTLVKAALPNGIGGPYQPLFKFAASLAAGGTAQGWLIESIAVVGTK